MLVYWAYMNILQSKLSMRHSMAMQIIYLHKVGHIFSLDQLVTE